MTDKIAVENHAGHQIAKGLAIFSFVLGACEVIWPSLFTRFLGLQGLEYLVMAYGVREIIAGIGIFASTQARAAWVWFRVAGDALDIATVLYAFAYPDPPIVHIAIAVVMLAGVTLIDIWCARTLSDQLQMAKTSRRYADRSGLG